MSVTRYPPCLSILFILCTLTSTAVASRRPARPLHAGETDESAFSIPKDAPAEASTDGEGDDLLHEANLPSTGQERSDEEIHYFEQPDFVLFRLSEQRWDRKLHKALNLPRTVELSLTHRTRFESVSHPWRRGQSSNTDEQGVQRTRLRLGFQEHDFWVLFEGQDARIFGHQPGEFFGNTVENRVDTQQLYVAYKDLTTFGSKLRTDVHAGRFNFEYGQNRLIGRNVLPNATNSFDGVHINVANGNRWRGRAFVTRPVERFVLDPDESFQNRRFNGLIYENAIDPNIAMELAALEFNDQRQPIASRTDFMTYNVRLHKNPAAPVDLAKTDKAGILDYDFDSAYQNGYKSVKQFRAGFVHAEVGYTMNRRTQGRFSLYYDWASGSKDPNNPRNLNTTFDRLFGLRDPDLGATANFGPFQRSNIVSYTARYEYRPEPSVRIFYKHAFRFLDEARDGFQASSLPGFAVVRDPTGRAGRNLGHDFELTVQKRFKTNFALEARWCHWWKGNYFDRLPANSGLPAGGKRDSDFVLVSAEMRL